MHTKSEISILANQASLNQWQEAMDIGQRKLSGMDCYLKNEDGLICHPVSDPSSQGSRITMWSCYLVMVCQLGRYVVFRSSLHFGPRINRGIIMYKQSPKNEKNEKHQAVEVWFVVQEKELTVKGQVFGKILSALVEFGLHSKYWRALRRPFRGELFQNDHFILGGSWQKANMVLSREDNWK